jgi:hypothetical protein
VIKPGQRQYVAHLIAAALAATPAKPVEPIPAGWCFAPGWMFRKQAN